MKKRKTYKNWFCQFVDHAPLEISIRRTPLIYSKTVQNLIDLPHISSMCEYLYPCPVKFDIFEHNIYHRVIILSIQQQQGKNVFVVKGQSTKFHTTEMSCTIRDIKPQNLFMETLLMDESYYFHILCRFRINEIMRWYTP